MATAPANPSDPTARYLEETRRIVLRALEGTSAKVYLFGSFASGRQRRSSDIDVAIDARSPLPTGLLAAVSEELEESHVPYRVDLVDLAHTDSAFRERVLRTGRLWNEPANG